MQTSAVAVITREIMGLCGGKDPSSVHAFYIQTEQEATGDQGQNGGLVDKTSFCSLPPHRRGFSKDFSKCAMTSACPRASNSRRVRLQRRTDNRRSVRSLTPSCAATAPHFHPAPFCPAARSRRSQSRKSSSRHVERPTVRRHCEHKVERSRCTCRARSATVRMGCSLRQAKTSACRSLHVRWAARSSFSAIRYKYAFVDARPNAR